MGTLPIENSFHFSKNGQCGMYDDIAGHLRNNEMTLLSGNAWTAGVHFRIRITGASREITIILGMHQWESL